MMGGMSWIHWLIVIFWIAAIGFPVAKILKRAGHSGWWAILAFVPFVNLVGLWIFANIKWPAEEGKL